MITRSNVISFFLFLVAILWNSELYSMTLNSDTLTGDSVTCTKDFFGRGHIHGHVRNHFMATINEGSLNDYWANGTGGALGYTTANFRGFVVGVKGIFSYNTFSSDLLEVDSVSGKAAKWEQELFDVLQPENKNDLDRLEELYIKYSHGKSSIAYGKMDLNKDPLLLRRDGRMKPFVYKGFWAEFNELKDQEITLGWLTHVSPRGMTEWFSMKEAIGMTNNGFQQDGSKADYHEKTNTRGLGVFSYSIKPNEHLKLKVTNYYMHQLFNLVWFQADAERENFFGGLQYVYQAADKQQVNLDFEERYYQPDENANILCGRVGYDFKESKSKVSFSYLHGFDTGRFLFPRELTRENFYVSQQRSWVDGFGAIDIYSIRLQKGFESIKSLNLDLRVERVEVPDSKDYTQNKYGVPSYYQATFISRLKPQAKLKGLEVMLLYVLRFSEPAQNITQAQKFYKTNFHHFSLITNFKF